MTDEERQKLLNRLRRTWWQDTKEVQEAAEEIERLAKDNKILWDLLRPQMGQSEEAKQKTWS
jgi:predicted TIM-barrel fold metal-dependent hydrolase